MGENLALFSNRVLRSAIQNNRVSFPAQAPVFVKNQAGEVQARIAHLYFVCGWTVRNLAAKYSMNSEMTRKTLNDWRARAISAGYIQELEPDGTEQPMAEVTSGSRESRSSEAEWESREEGSKSFLVVRNTTASPTFILRRPPCSRPSSNDVHEMLLEEIEMGVGTSTRWPVFCLRLLGILKQECTRRGFLVAAAQIDRIEATEERDASVARDLLRDLRVRMLDEERVCASAGNAEDHAPGALHALVLEIDAAVRDAALKDSAPTATWPSYCTRLLATVKEGCSKLRLRLTATQVNRIEDTISGDTYQLRDQLRDLGNRLLDELEYKKQADLPVVTQRHLTAGAAR